MWNLKKTSIFGTHLSYQLKYNQNKYLLIVAVKKKKLTNPINTKLLPIIFKLILSPKKQIRSNPFLIISIIPNTVKTSTINDPNTTKTSKSDYLLIN